MVKRLCPVDGLLWVLLFCAWVGWPFCHRWPSDVVCMCSLVDAAEQSGVDWLCDSGVSFAHEPFVGSQKGAPL